MRSFVYVTDKPRLIQAMVPLYDGQPGCKTYPMWKCFGLINGDAEYMTGFTPRQAYDHFMEEKRRRRPIIQKLRDWINHAEVCK